MSGVFRWRPFLAALLSAAATVQAQAPTDREKLAVIDLRALGEAVAAYAAEHGSCPLEGEPMGPVERLADMVSPPLGRQFAATDAWGRAYLYWCDGKTYVILTHGADGKPGSRYENVSELGDVGDDLVWSNGHLRKSPDHITLALGRELQRSTLIEMRFMARALADYVEDKGGYPVTTEDYVDIEILRASMYPKYIDPFPAQDGWGNPILFWCDGKRYQIVSTGQNGMRQQDYRQVTEPKSTTILDADLVIDDGRLLRWPAGPQKIRAD